ncbi:MAG: relaxase/mobilization nuclease domain-containing protein [Pseudomonas balearica]|uniref:relaxase/mobilization nuclease domain-containing protein n=1 Tax=Stutzerimonas balearica TaxID=74829 RepID=UPI00198F5D0C|nr:relaxase/mobilization nuclease domain-containing protein [Stutzerimonas balearica]MBC7200393.1 relaxase/mobilization nuclease domain-containing protein [Stutzerimonas balearica]
MKFKIRTRHANARFTVKYIQKYAKPGSMRSTIPKFENTSDWDYAKLVDKKFEQGRAKGQQRLYLHQIVAFHPSDSHKSDQELLDIAEESLKMAMPGKRHYVMAVERDKAHPHVHIVVGLRSLDTKRVHRDFVDYIEIGKELEIKHGLYNADRTQKPSPYAPAPNTVQIERRSGQKTIKNDLKDKVATALETAQDTASFIDTLDAFGVQILPGLNAGGLYGASFALDGEIFKGSQLNISAKKIKDKFSADPFFILLMQDAEKKAKAYAEKNTLEANGSKPNLSTNLRNRTLDKHFESADDKTYFYKNTNKKAFNYDAEKNAVAFDHSNYKNIKAGMQKMIENGATELQASGSDRFKRQAWIVGIQNGYPMADFYQPSLDDFEQALKTCMNEKQREKIKEEMEKQKQKEREKQEQEKPKNRMKLKI